MVLSKVRGHEDGGYRADDVRLPACAVPGRVAHLPQVVFEVSIRKKSSDTRRRVQ